MWEEWLNWIHNQLKFSEQDDHAHSLSSLVIFRIVHKCQFSPQLQMFQKTTLVSAKCQMCRSCQLSSMWRRRMGWDWLKQVCNRTSCRSERNADCPPPPALRLHRLRSAPTNPQLLILAPSGHNTSRRRLQLVSTGHFGKWPIWSFLSAVKTPFGGVADDPVTSVTSVTIEVASCWLCRWPQVSDST